MKRIYMAVCMASIIVPLNVSAKNLLDSGEMDNITAGASVYATATASGGSINIANTNVATSSGQYGRYQVHGGVGSAVACCSNAMASVSAAGNSVSFSSGFGLAIDIGSVTVISN